MFAIIDIGNLFADGNGQNRLAIEFGGLDIVLDEAELLHELVFVEIGIEVVKCKAELLIRFCRIDIFRFHTVLILHFDIHFLIL